MGCTTFGKSSGTVPPFAWHTVKAGWRPARAPLFQRTADPHVIRDTSGSLFKPSTAETVLRIQRRAKPVTKELRSGARAQAAATPVTDHYNGERGERDCAARALPPQTHELVSVGRQ
ncbi:hypothetical protein SRHO_G00212290 [Serrasalmus rhombeus]